MTKRENGKSSKKPLITGRVLSCKQDKTISVKSYSYVKHPRYGKYIKRETVYKVHDEKNQAKSGDSVRICSVRPLSKTKRWRLKDIVEKEGEVS